MATNDNVKSQNHDVRRQLFLGITKKIKSSTSSARLNGRHEEIVSPTTDSVPQFLLPSSSHTIPKSPRSRRISQKLYTPTNTFSSNGNSSMSIETSTDGLRLPPFVKSDAVLLLLPPPPLPLTKLILHKKEDINDYDYHTFSSKHSLRTSKIKALEQAEVTASLYFNFELNDDVEDVLNEDENNEVLICLPGLDRKSTKMTVEQFQLQFQQGRRKEAR